jgi:hypothetical protein
MAKATEINYLFGIFSILLIILLGITGLGMIALA